VRRRRSVPGDGPPRELREFDPHVWAGAVPVADREAATSPDDRAFAAWLEARERWRSAFGWPVDSVAFAREEVHAILARIDQDAA